jgi:hypothetical protein
LVLFASVQISQITIDDSSASFSVRTVSSIAFDEDATNGGGNVDEEEAIIRVSSNSNSSWTVCDEDATHGNDGGGDMEEEGIR